MIRKFINWLKVEWNKDDLGRTPEEQREYFDELDERMFKFRTGRKRTKLEKVLK